MYSLSIKKGKPIAYESSRKIIIRLLDNSKSGYTDTSDNINEHSQTALTLMPLPSPDHADRFFIVGGTGAGKSTFIKEYINTMDKFKKSKRKLIISDVLPSDDKVLSTLDAGYLRLDDSLITQPIQTPELEDSIVIADDIDSIGDPKIKKAVLTLVHAIFAKGSSKNNITLFSTYHNVNSSKETTNMLLNCNFFVFFPASKLGIPFHR